MEGFKYHASAVGLKVRIEAPFDAELPPVASVDLQPEGGFRISREKEFRFEGIVSARSIDAVVAGSFDEPGAAYDELASVVMEGFNVLGIVTADRIVARLTAVHRRDGPPSITPLGSHFDNLRIAGHRVDVDLAVDTFTRLDTTEKIHGAYEGNEGGFREEFASLSLLGKFKEIPQRLHAYFPSGAKQPEQSVPMEEGKIQCGLVRGLSGLPAGLTSRGNVIYIPGFGVIRLAELRIERSARELTMVNIDLGSTPKGCVAAGHVRGNGSGW